MNTESRETPPRLSVIVAAWSGKEALTRCLESVIPQVGTAEVIVAFRADDIAALLEKHFPEVRAVRGTAEASVFLLRSLGVAEARGRLIAMLEDHSIVCTGWAEAMLAAHVAGKMICGGPIENDGDCRSYEWALYFAEYGIYLPPMPAGEMSILSGANIAYDREMLLSCHEVWESVFYETDVNAALVGAGHKLYMLPEACVTSRLRLPLREAIQHLYSGGIHFGDFRKSKSGLFVRWLRLIAAPAVPVVLLLRIIRLTMMRQPARVFQIIRALPYLLLLLGAWSAGEARSYARGDPPHRQ